MKKIKKVKEDGSVNSLGAIPTGRLVTKKKKSIRKLINPLKETNMSLAKKYLGILFEDQAEPMEPEASEPEPMEPEADLMPVAMAELEDLIKEMEDGEMKDKLMGAAMKLKSLCKEEEESEESDDMDDEEAPEEASIVEAEEVWDDETKSGKKVKVTKPEHSPSLRQVHDLDGKYISSYDTRQSSEAEEYRKKYKQAK